MLAFWSEGLNHEDVFNAIEHRQTFATTGHRPVLDFFLVDQAQQIPMGTAYIPSAPQAHIRYHGTQSVERVQLFGIAERPNAERELLWEITEPELDTIETLDLEAHIDLSAPNSTAIWIETIQSDGEKAWSSPIWLSSSL